MGQLILLVILVSVFLGVFSHLLELALKHKYFAIFLVVFAYLTSSIWVALLILLFHRVYQNPQVKWQVDAYREKPKRWWENKKVLYRSIKNYKEESKDRIRLKYHGEISFLCYKVFSPILDTQEGQTLEALKKEILEKETLLSDLQKEKNDCLSASES